MPVGKKNSSGAGAPSAGTGDSAARQHTSLPWAYERGECVHSGSHVITARHAGMTAATPLAHVNGLLDAVDASAEADARFIVRACNAHYKLVEALEVAREHVRFFCEETDDEGTEDCKRDLALIDAAISKATS